jgi:hypothetical protein
MEMQNTLEEFEAAIVAVKKAVISRGFNQIGVHRVNAVHTFERYSSQGKEIILHRFWGGFDVYVRLTESNELPEVLEAIGKI